jgi:hypothetical protein
MGQAIMQYSLGKEFQIENWKRMPMILEDKQNAPEKSGISGYMTKPCGSRIQN